MDELKQMVKDLEKDIYKDPLDGRSRRVRILQRISEKILSEYCIKVGNLTIEPLLIEAYYFHKGKFEDYTTHRNKQQTKFAKLYRHTDKKIDSSKGRVGGVDICLADNDNNLADNEKYYLSFLIKNSLVDGKFYSQRELNALLNNINENIEEMDNVLQHKSKEQMDDKIVFHTVRKGLKSVIKNLSEKQLSEEKRIEYEKSLPFIYERLAAVKGLDRYKFDLEVGFSSDVIVAQYIHEYQKYSSEIDREKMSMELLGYKLDKIWEEFY